MSTADFSVAVTDARRADWKVAVVSASGTIERAESDVDMLTVGAVGDGVTDEWATYKAARDAMVENGIIRFPGHHTYKFAQAGGLTKSMTIRGDGMWVTTLLGGASPIFASGGLGADAVVDRVVFEDLCFDGAGANQTIVNLSNTTIIRRVEFRRCRFTNIAATAIAMQGGRLHVEDCLFHNPAAYAGLGKAVLAQAGCYLKMVGDTRAFWLNQVMATENFSGDARITERVDIFDGDFDFFWPYIPATEAGSGGTVTYTSTVLTDTGKDFTAILGARTVAPGTVVPNAGAYPNCCPVRMLPVRFSSAVAGTTGITTTNAAALVDTGATFTTASVARGDLVRVPSANCFAIVSGIESQTIVRVEEWLDNTTLRPTATPPVGAAYTVYQLLYGYATAKTATTLTFPYITDYFGNRVTPAAGTLYEVMQARPAQMFAPGASTRKVVYDNVRCRRSWADAIGTVSQRTNIRGCSISDGQDLGISILGPNVQVIGCLIEHCGTAAVRSAGNFTLIVGNEMRGCGWNFASASSTSMVKLDACTGCRVAYNVIEATSEGVQVFAGVALLTSGGSHTVAGNAFSGLPANSDVYIDNAAVTACVVRGTTQIGGIAGAAPLVDVSGAGNPGGVVKAAVGSTFRRTDGGSTTSFYVKESGTGNSGWTAK